MAQGLLGGVLPAIYSKADELKRGVYGLLTNPQEQIARASQSLLQSHNERQALMKQAFANPERPFQVTDTQALGQLGNDVLMGELGFAPAGITAWHGSPYKFDKFDISKIGTGEGNQSYGYGGYFAEAPAVAKQYQASLSDTKYFSGGQQLKGNDAWAAQFLHDFQDDALPKKVDVKTAVAKANEILKSGEARDEIVNKIKQLDKAGVSVESGSLYKVDIPDEYIPKMLDYDKPLSQQPKDVIDSLKKLNDPYINEALTTKPKLSADGEYWTYMGNTYATKQEALEDVTGQRLISGYTNIAKNPQELSSVLNSVGIKGVKYLDQDSRMIGNGTSNFVVFDPETVKILERNGISVESLLGN